MTTTAMVAIEITCPPWCTISPEQHAADLWNNGGDVFHHAPVELVGDPSGYREPLAEPRFYPPVEVRFTMTTNPDGRETASPIFYVHDQEHSLEQFLSLQQSMSNAVALYRSEVSA